MILRIEIDVPDVDDTLVDPMEVAEAVFYEYYDWAKANPSQAHYFDHESMSASWTGNETFTRQ